MPNHTLARNSNPDPTTLRITRREFLGAAGGLVLGFVLPSLPGVNDACRRNRDSGEFMAADRHG
ncbi:MAG: hypothetical protein IPI73_21390 [Betaproteobacteria bacterium]|nr:hypothetical protein [Betaproteobacteria bacterium]